MDDLLGDDRPEFVSGWDTIFTSRILLLGEDDTLLYALNHVDKVSERSDRA